MPKQRQDLTKRQEAAVKRFVKAQKELVRGSDRLYQNRLKALEAALNAGVYATLLSERSGLAQSRLYQLRGEIRNSQS
jgi:hypothetical protein